MKHINENMVSEAFRIRNGEDAVKLIINCLTDNEVFYEICDAADMGKTEVRSFVDDYGDQILDGIRNTLIETWNDNY